MNVWVDDRRPPPGDGWMVARDIGHARWLIGQGVGAVSLDHDLGGRAGGSGLDLAQWMVETGNVPAHVTVHSANPHGAAQIMAVFAQAGHQATMRPEPSPPSKRPPRERRRRAAGPR